MCHFAAIVDGAAFANIAQIQSTMIVMQTKKGEKMATLKKIFKKHVCKDKGVKTYKDKKRRAAKVLPYYEAVEKDADREMIGDDADFDLGDIGNK